MTRWGRRFRLPLFLCATAIALPPEQFTDVTSAAKLDFQHHNSPTTQKYLPESMGGGVAMFDYDNDGRLDLFFTNGAKLDDPMQPAAKPDKSDRRYWNRLYHQDANGTFTDVTEAAGLSGARTAVYTMGVAAGDYDNDGFTDLYVTGLGGNTLYHNNGNGTFTDVTPQARVGAGGWSTSAGFFDYNNDGKLDLFVCRYLEWSYDKNSWCGDAATGRAYCDPKIFKGVTSILFRNNGDGTFTDVSAPSGIAGQAGKALGVAFADYDNDGFTDIYVANDTMQCFLYHNQRDGAFKEVALRAGAGLNEDGNFFAGMGTDFADFDNDGLADIVVTDLAGETYMLYKNNGDGTFSEISGKSGLGALSQAHSGWGIRFLDFDNDGWKDLVAAQGHVMDNIERVNSRKKYLEPPMLLRNVRGRFSPVGETAGKAFSYSWAGRGLATGDIDNDGALDVAIANCGQKAHLLRNQAGIRNHWLGIQAVGSASNRDGLGCRVKAVTPSGLTQFYTINTAGSYLSASDKRLIVGLGHDTTVKLLEVRWPSGVVQTFNNLKGDRMLTLHERGGLSPQ